MAALVAGIALAAPASTASAQRDSASKRVESVTIAPGPQYKTGPLGRTWAGSGWRDVWTTPVRVPVLDMETHAGGLKLKKRGGGSESLVLHLEEEDGYPEYRFRSVNKNPTQAMPDAVRGTVVGNILQDQVSAYFPAAPILVHPLLGAIGALYVEPEMYVMGDSPRLGKERGAAAGLLGTFELKGEEGPDDKPGFGGSTAVKDSEDFFEDLASGREHRLDEREFLAIRLVDFLVNDPDRSRDNFDWARFGTKDAYTWRPIARDRDRAFINARGLLNTLVLRRAYPKLLPFEARYRLRGLTYGSHVLDRQLLQRLTAEDFRAIALRVRGAITDPVIAQVIAQMPAEWREQTDADDRLAATLRARRDALPDVAMQFYYQLAREVDVYGTDDADRIEVERLADGRVSVTITDPDRTLLAERRSDGTVVTTSDGALASLRSPADAYFRRTFLPAETKEVRVYARGGNDIAVVRGAGSDALVVRIIGGKGDDVLADSAGGGSTRLYDAEGENRFLTSSGTFVNTRPWTTLEGEHGFRLGEDWRPDWGRSRGWRPALDYKTGAGLIVGVGPRFRSYGFRRLPHKFEANAKLLYGLGNGRFGLTFDADRRAENAPHAFRLSARASQLEATRFFGYGNDTPIRTRENSLVHQTEVSVEPMFVRLIGWRSREGLGNPLRGTDSVRTLLRPLVGELRIGPTASWFHPDPAPGAALTLPGVTGGADFGVAGGAVELELDKTDEDAVPTAGWKLRANVAGYPLLSGPGNGFGTASARGSFYVPLMRVGAGPHLAFRLGGSMATGDYPAQFAAAMGGRSTVRGFSYRRFAGDAATHGSAELRVPVGTVNFLIKSQLGVFTLADAGRVWFDGRSDGGWHSGVGGGLWLSALGRSVSVAYARGEKSRFYLNGGLFY